ncbi:MAG: hypothetical protein Q8R33_09010 [Burkholderiales bacterium]|nr:hypothetical protein [Burkholderiales bacterium]
MTTRAFRKTVAAHLGALLLCGVATHTARAAPPLPDPTRPAAFAEPAASSAVMRRNETAVVTAPAAPRLQSVQLAANGASSALVDGRLVRVGSRVGELAVFAIDEQGLWLRGARQDKRLSLLPGVAKLASGAAPITPRPVLHVATTKETP